VAELEPPNVAGLLADPDRRRAFAAVVLGASTVAEIGARADLDPKATTKALERLVSSGLVGRTDDGDRLMLIEEALRDAARSTAASAPAPRGPTPEELGATPEQASVLRNFMKGGRLQSIPSAAGKRRLILDFLAGQFEPGQTYPEKDVNFMLMKFHPDAAALRRYLVDEGFLERRDGFYWRAGGTFEPE
jgi:hypothetical protein